MDIVEPERTATKPPVAHQPLGLAVLLREATAGRDLTLLGERLLEHTQRYDDPDALLDLSLVLQLKHQKESALAVQALALQRRGHYRLRNAQPGQSPVRLLALKAPGDLMANTPFECLLDELDVQIDVVYVEGHSSDAVPLPEHDVLIVAACASDANAPVLARIGSLVAAHPRRVLNRPEGIALTTRDAAYALLGKVPGICMAHTVRLPRQRLVDAACGAWDLSEAVDGRYPFIVRPVNSHAGQALERISDGRELAQYLERTEEVEEYYVAPFIDYSGADGLFRKYRIVLIEGKPFLCHMGISRHWMVHYPYHEMIAHPERREEEASLMANFDSTFAVRHSEALRAVAALTGLDYVGFDCAETADGRLLIFEIATGMVIHDMDDPDLFPYKLAQMRRVFGAFHDMLRRAATSDRRIRTTSDQ
jgi:glutathione synthase/RimK-type ligase-like ATP-grasp enzyme